MAPLYKRALVPLEDACRQVNCNPELVQTQGLAHRSYARPMCKQALVPLEDRCRQVEMPTLIQWLARTIVSDQQTQ